MTTLDPESGHQQEDEIELRHHFDDELAEIRSGLVEMSSLVVENTRLAGEAAIDNRLDLVDVVRAADDPIDDLYVTLERRTFELLALQQPVAADLRFLVAATRILYEVERSGDLAVNIVNRVAAKNRFPQVDEVRRILQRLVIESTRVFASAVEAIADLDPEIGAVAEESDDVVDKATEQFFAAVHAHSAEFGLDSVVNISHIGRFLERIADHGVNIAQNISYVVTGSFPNGETGDLPE